MSQGGNTILRKNSNQDGYYEPSLVVEETRKGKMMLTFSDSSYIERNEGMEVRRQMKVGKQPIIVRSFFAVDGAKTPTQKMLYVIDSELDKQVA